MNKIVAFGEIMLRLSTINHELIENSNSFSAHYGGSESNVLVSLSALGNKTDYISVIPNNEIGNSAINHLKKYNVGTSFIIRKGDNLGLYFLEQGFGERSSKVVYNRRHAAVTEIDENDIDFEKLFEGCSLFHVCGISLALSKKCHDAVLRLCKEAKNRNILISFDFNYRSKLWTIDDAKPSYKEIMDYIDICIGNIFDLNNFLDIKEETTEETILSFFNKYPAKYLCFNKREILSSTINKLTGYIYTKVDNVLVKEQSGPYQFEILDRIGSGDCFTAGILHVLNKDINDYKKAIEYAIASDVLKHSIAGDVSPVKESDILSFINKKSKDVQR